MVLPEEPDVVCWQPLYNTSIGAPLEPMQKGEDELSFSRRFANADVEVSCVAPRGTLTCTCTSSIVWKKGEGRSGGGF